jgi:hypothetical protein
MRARIAHERAVKAAEQTREDLLRAINDGLGYQSAWRR